MPAGGVARRAEGPLLSPAMAPPGIDTTLPASSLPERCQASLPLCPELRPPPACLDAPAPSLAQGTPAAEQGPPVPPTRSSTISGLEPGPLRLEPLSGTSASGSVGPTSSTLCPVPARLEPAPPALPVAAPAASQAPVVPATRATLPQGAPTPGGHVSLSNSSSPCVACPPLRPEPPPLTPRAIAASLDRIARAGGTVPAELAAYMEWMRSHPEGEAAGITIVARLLADKFGCDDDRSTPMPARPEPPPPAPPIAAAPTTLAPAVPAAGAAPPQGTPSSGGSGSPSGLPSPRAARALHRPVSPPPAPSALVESIARVLREQSDLRPDVAAYVAWARAHPEGEDAGIAYAARLLAAKVGGDDGRQETTQARPEPPPPAPSH